MLALSNVLSLGIFAQSAQNSISLEITRVSKNGQIVDTRQVGTNGWLFDSSDLTLDDLIRYRWKNVALDTKYVSSPARGGGYLRIYLNDDTKEDNFITNFGSSPLPVSLIAPRLVDGRNTIVFVYVDSLNPSNRDTKVSFTFGFKNITSKPQIRVISPDPNTFFAKGVERDITLELNNFALDPSDTVKESKGKLNVYYNEVKQQNLLGTVKTSTPSSENKQTAVVNSEALEFGRIPDSLDTKLIFVLTRADGQLTDTQIPMQIRTNYNGTVNIGVPKVAIFEPRKDRTNLSVDGNQKFLISVENFEILPEIMKGKNEDNKGYLQIFVDDMPIKIMWPKTDFSLNEIGYVDSTEGRKTVKVQLVNKDFTKFLPEASDSIDIVYVPDVLSTDPAMIDAPQAQNNTWRMLIIILTVVLIIGGIAILITRG